MRSWMAGLMAMIMMSMAVPARAADSATALKTRADALVAVLGGTGAPAASFSPAFLAAVPEAQLSAITAQLRGQLGAVERVAAIRPEGAYAASVDFAYSRGTVTMRLVVDTAPPHLATGLLVTKVAVAGDSFDKLKADLAALPGSSGFSVARLGAAPVTVAEHNGERSYAVGSAFKLYVLAEAMRAIAAGERRWDGIVPLSRKSLPSGFLQNWPAGSPLTLHSLAALMISQSDNSATDTLIATLGREKVEAMLAATEHSEPARNQPFLETNEMFLLKGNGGSVLLAKWLASDAAARRTMLAEAAKMDRSKFDYGNFTGPPRAIDTVEWFATPADIVRVLDWIRRNDPDGMGQAILAINPGIGAAADYGYLGFKGGSETGVINLSFLVRSKAGAWYAITGSWNNPAAAVDEAKFVGLMSRAVALAAK